MLGKRSRPIQKTTVSTPDTEGIDSNNTNKHSLFITPRIFIGFKPSLDPEGAKSPTSPLDIKTFSGVGISYLHDKQLRSPRPSALESLSSPRPWERKNSQGIGLGIVASLTNTTSDCSNTITSVQGSKLRIFVGGSMGSPKNPSSPPRAIKDAFEGGGEELEHSESYTCVISHGPQCSTKHIYTSDEVVKFSVETQHHSEICNNGASSSSTTAAFCVSSDDTLDYTMGDFLTSCYLCKKKLSAGKDIYMYRGDKAFCSVECRYQQILSDERNEAISGSPSSSVFVFGSSIAA